MTDLSGHDCSSDTRRVSGHEFTRAEKDLWNSGFKPLNRWVKLSFALATFRSRKKILKREHFHSGEAPARQNANKQMPPFRARILSHLHPHLAVWANEFRCFAVEACKMTYSLLIPCFCAGPAQKPAFHAAFRALTKKFPVIFPVIGEIISSRPTLPSRRRV
jgi:hypothetical protein